MIYIIAGVGMVYKIEAFDWGLTLSGEIPEMSLQAVKVLIRDSKVVTCNTGHMSGATLGSIAAAMSLGALLCFDAGITQEKLVAVAVALNTGTMLFLPPNTTQEKMVAIAVALNTGGTLLLHSNTTQEKMVAVAEALSPVGTLFPHPNTTQEKMVCCCGGAKSRRCAISTL